MNQLTPQQQQQIDALRTQLQGLRWQQEHDSAPGLHQESIDAQAAEYDRLLAANERIPNRR